MKPLTSIFWSSKMWAQAVQNDTTFMVLHTGASEFIGMRHRESQTLYLGPRIWPHMCKKPSYTKLHVGLYIAAFRDAVARARRLDLSKVNGVGRL